MANGYNTSANQTRNNAYNYDPSQAPSVDINGGKSFNYTEIYSNASPESSAGSTKNKNSSSSSVGLWGINMGVSHNYTFAIEDINDADGSFYMKSRNSAFLPLKSLTYTPVKLNHLKIKAGVFNDLPFFHRRSMGTIQCVMHDSDKSLLSRRILDWFSGAVGVDGIVPYIDDLCKEAEYIEYTHDGKIALKYTFEVIPDNDLSVSRAYETEQGTLTEYKFSLIIVSNIGIAVGEGGQWREAAYGTGGGPLADYERVTEAKLLRANGQTYSSREPSIAEDLGIPLR